MHNDLHEKLRAAGLRATRQRLDLAGLLFAHGNRHVTAEHLSEEALRSGVSVSIATIYNTLNQFCDVGILRAVQVDSSKTYFDTNTSPHQHFYCEQTDELIDIDGWNIDVNKLPKTPDGTQISNIDVVVRITAA
jgi:Fur family iron response transcriptional regulator